MQVGYFAQDHRGSIRNGTTVEEWLHDFDPQASREEIRGLLGQMLFRGEEGAKPTDALSGGEAARLIFCKLMLLKPNFLVFDEPTNHLDLEAINALNIALQKFEGTVLLVTHDEDLIDEVATRIWHFTADGKIRGLRRTVRRVRVNRQPVAGQLYVPATSRSTLLQQLRNQSGPSGLMTRAQTRAIVSVKEFVEQNVVAEMRVGLKEFVAVVDGPPAVRSRQE